MKKFLIGLLSVLCIFVMAGCDEVATVESEKSGSTSMFVFVEKADVWAVVYHKETKVMYAVSYDKRNYGNFTLLVDENGNPLLWED